MLSGQDQLGTPLIACDSVESTADEIRLQIDLRVRLDEASQTEAEILRADRRQHPSRQELCRLACYFYDARRIRDRLFAPNLFGEPVWDILLALYCLPARGERLGASALSYAANLPVSTGVRWQETLIAKGLIERGPMEPGPRKRFLRLTDRGRTLLERCLERLYQCNAAVPRFPERAGG